ncbi:hypothetical protein TSUD_288160 [Trifolium subterraneum]|uniref:Secreted protein n=1 Tax=Trifolium subterraneum TaxID=3900 RepID=A0A2Z6NBS1_TRISU|nr:hypothetical protein TSUD_288160 [Trifolium subterraneum]
MLACHTWLGEFTVACSTCVAAWRTAGQLGSMCHAREGARRAGTSCIFGYKRKNMPLEPGSDFWRRNTHIHHRCTLDADESTSWKQDLS